MAVLCVALASCAAPPRVTREPVRVPFLRAPEPSGPPHAEFFNLNAVTPFHDVARGEEDAWETQRTRLERASALGVHSIRTDFWWSMVESEPGEFDWTVADKAIETIAEAGLEPFPILSYASRWADTPAAFEDPEERARFARWARTAARRHRESVTWFSAWNEPNIPPYWTPRANPGLYNLLFSETAEEVRAAHPDARIVGMVTAGPDTGFIESAYRAGAAEWTDAVSFHHYSSELDEWVLKEEIRRVRRLMDRYGDSEAPLWITESGQSTLPSAVVAQQSHEDQADWIVKKHLVALAHGVERFYYFKMQDDPPERDPDGGWGLLEADGTRKPSWYAYKTMVATVSPATFIGRAFGTEARASRRDEAEVQLYRDADDGVFAVAWVRRNGPDATIHLPADGPVTIRSIAGERIEEREPNEDGVVSIRLSASPRYIKGLGERAAALASVRVSPAQLYIAPGETRTLTLSFRNRLDEEVSIPLERLIEHGGPGGLEIRADRNALTVPPGRERSIELTVRLDPEAEPFEPFVLRSNDGRGISYEAVVHYTEAFELDLYTDAEAPDSQLMVWMDYRNLTADSVVVDTRIDQNGRTLMETPGRRPQAPGEERSVGHMVVLDEGEATIVGKVTSSAGPTVSAELALWKQPFREDRPTVDGSLEEWEHIEPARLRPGRHQAHPPRTERRLRAEDTSADVRLWWTEDTLYIGADIADATPQTNPFRENNLWRGDSLELYLGFDGPSRNSVYGPSDFQIGLSPGHRGNNPFAWNWVPLQTDGEAVPAEGLRIENAEIATQRTDNGYTLEAAIPLAEFGVTVEPGQVIGLTVHLNDRADDSLQGRGNTLIWSGTPQNWRNPSGWGVALIARPASEE